MSATVLEERVEIVKLSAGSDGRLIRCAVETGSRGLVIEALGRGNVPPASRGEPSRADASALRFESGRPVSFPQAIRRAVRRPAQPMRGSDHWSA